MARDTKGLRFSVQYRGFDSLPAALELLRRQLAEIMDLERISLRAEKQTKQRFKLFGPRAKRSPDGKRWSSLARSTLADRRRKGYNNPRDILVRTGNLRDSIKAVRTSFRIVQGLGTATWVVGITGPASAYGYVMNSGNRKVPARPFLGLSEKDQKQIQKDMDAAGVSAVRAFAGRMARPSRFLSGSLVLNALSRGG